jgi:hypothetical protein
MPTSTGLPQKGEHLRDPEGGVWRVVDRHGTGADYSLTLIPMTRPIKARRYVRDHHHYGDPEGTMRLMEASWHVGRGWTLLSDELGPLPRPLEPQSDFDPPVRGGWWNMACWNGLSEDQQTRLIQVGNLPMGYEPEGDCRNGAAVAVECEGDEASGPRFYCLSCAVLYLAGRWKEQRG